METLTEALVEKELSPYEIERNKPMPNLTHGAIQANLIFELKLNFRDQYRVASEVSLATLPQGSTPDIVLYSKRSLNFVSETAKQTEPPLLAIEIQSPSQSNEQMVEKAIQYFAFGVKSCWIVFPALKSIAVYSDPDQSEIFQHGETLKDPVMGVEVELGKVFE